MFKSNVGKILLGYNYFMGSPEEFYEYIFNNSTEGVFQSTPKGRYLRVNPAMAKIYGYASPEEMIQSVTDIARQIHASPKSRSMFTKIMKEKGMVENFEAQNKRKDGTLIWTTTHARAVRDASEKILYYVGFVQDITARKQMDKSLGIAEIRYRTLVEQAPVAVYIDPPQDNLETSIYISPQIHTISGYTVEEWNARGGWLSVIHPDDRERFIHENEDTNRTGRPFDIEYRILHKDGHIVWLRDLAKQACDADGNPLYWHGTVIDVTEQKNLQQTILQSEDRFRKAFQASPIAICITTYKDGIFLDVNEAYERLVELPRKDLIGRSVSELRFFDVKTRAKWMKEFKAAGESIHGQASTFITASGKALDTIAFYETIEEDGRKAILSMIYDITTQTQAEAALHQSETRYRALVEHISAIVYLDQADGSNQTIYINPQVESITGYTPAEWMENPDLWANIIHPDDRERVRRKDRETNESGAPFSEEYRLITRDGNVIWVQEESTLIRDKDGRPLYWQGFLIDITSKKQAQESIRDIASSYRGLFDSVSDAIFIQDRQSRFLDVNLGAVKLYGHPHDYFIGKTHEAFGAPGRNDLEAVSKHIESAFQGVPQQFEFWGLRKNREIFPQEVHAYKGTFFGQDVVFTLTQDITERRRAIDAQERQLKELSVLHTLTVAGTRAPNEDALIEQATNIISDTLYPDVLGFLMLTEDGKHFYPHPSYRGLTNPEQKHNYEISEGITGLVARTARPANVPDVRKKKDYIQINPNSLSELCVPMTIGDRVIGVINTESYKLDFFTADDERLLLTVAGQLALAIERLRKERSENEQRMLAEALRDIASMLNSTLEFDTVMERILENIDRVVPSKSANIMLLDGRKARIIRYRGYTDHGMEEWWETFNANIEEMPDFSREKESHLPQLIADTQSDPLWVSFPATTWIRSHLSAPILENEGVIGFINLDSDTPDFFTHRDAERLMAFANQAATAIQNASLFQAESRRAKIIEALADIANVIATTREIGVALDEIAQRSLNLLKASHIAIYLLQDDDETLKIITAKGSYREELLSHTIKVGRGITGSIVASGKAEIINDTGQDSRRIRVPGTPDDSGSETMMSAPLILRGKSIGAINAWRLRTNALFGDSELNFLVSIAHQASIAIESGRLFEETIRRSQETAAIAEVGRNISSTLQLDVVLERIATYARDLLKADTSAVYLADSASAELRATAAIGTDAEEIKNDPLRIGTGILGNIAMQKTGEIVNDTQADPRAIIIKGTGDNPFEHIMGVPVLLKGKLTGLLAVWRIGAGLDYKSTDLDFLSGLAQQAAIAIENARLYLSEQQRRQEAETLREATAVVATTLDRERAIELILDQLARVLKYESAAIQLLRDGYLEIVGGRGWQSDREILGMRFPIPGDNPNTIVIQERRPVVMDRVNNKFESFRDGPHSHIRSWLGAPLIAHGEVIGMLSVDSAEEDSFGEEQVRLVTAYANQAAIAIDNAQLHEKSENQIRRLTALRDVDTAIASSLDLRVTLNILMDNAISQLHTDAMSIMIYNPNLQILEAVAMLGFRNGSVRRQVRIGEELAGKIAMTRRPLQVQDLNSAPEYSRLAWIAEEKFVAYAGYPLLGKGQIKGVIEAFFRTPYTPNTDWLEFMQTMAGQAAIAIDNAQLFENLQRSNQELSLAYDTTLEGWGKALELRDKETQGHTRRVTELTMRLARRMNISDNEITHIRRGVLLHDIGKMGVPDQILRKTGPLDQAEWELMRQHPQYAYDLLHPIAYLRPALDIPYCHHEKWDGSGYPRGLKGHEIPLAARIFAVVDVWDALLSDRPYRRPWSRKMTMDYLVRESGTRFDPTIVNIFTELISENKQG